MKALSAALLAHMAQGTTTLATCWKATLRNGTIVRATSLDRNLEYPPGSGEIYLASTAYNSSDVESGAEFNPDNLELEGFLAAPAITAVDLHSGIWDYAAVEIFEVNYEDLSMGARNVRTGTLGEVRGRRSKFVAELRGLMQAYSRRIIELTSLTCRADLGDSRCTIDLAPLTVAARATGAVTSDRILAVPELAQEAGYFTGGLLTFTAGLNAGLSMEVKRHTLGQLELHEAMPFAIASDASAGAGNGDSFTLTPGCMKRFTEDCVGKFANGPNFQGEPHQPGSAGFGREDMGGEAVA